MSSPTSAPAGARWFALHTLSGQEGKVKTYIEKFKKAEELDDFIFEVLLPTEVVSEVKGGKKSTKVRKLYPGYVFIQARLFDEEGKLINKPWYFVKETTGVIGFVGGDRPAALRQSEIELTPNVGNDETSKFIQGVCHKNDELLILIDLEKMIEIPQTHGDVVGF